MPKNEQEMDRKFIFVAHSESFFFKHVTRSFTIYDKLYAAHYKLLTLQCEFSTALDKTAMQAH